MVVRQRKNWFRLDNAGKMYSSLTSTRVTTIFRVSATLKDFVELEILQHALQNIIDRFPYYRVNLKKGLFWYYYDYTNEVPKVQKEVYYPCMHLDIKKKGIFPFRVLYYRKKISVEFSHSITDGNGAIVFLKSLLYEYFRLLGKEVKTSYHEGIFKYNEEPKEEEFEEAFRKYYNSKTPKPQKIGRAFHFPFKLEKKGIYYVITGIVSADAILAKAKEYNVSLTEFICAVYFDSILDLIKKNQYKKRPIVLNVPVNLRKMLPSKTMRNFFVSITPQIDPRLGSYSFEEILKYVHNFMQIQVDKRYINQQITRNVRSEKSLFLRGIPLVIKDIVMPMIYTIWGESSYTSGISNLGRIEIPHELYNYVSRIEIVPPPSAGNKIKIAVNSFGDKLYITFGKLTSNREIEKIFFRKLRKLGIHIKIEGNMK